MELSSDDDVAEIRCLAPGTGHPLDPSWVPLPVPGGRVKYTVVTGSGAWHPLTPSLGAIRGVPEPQIIGKVEVIQLVRTAMEQCVMYKCHRACWKR